MYYLLSCNIAYSYNGMQFLSNLCKPARVNRIILFLTWILYNYTIIFFFLDTIIIIKADSWVLLVQCLKKPDPEHCGLAFQH